RYLSEFTSAHQENRKIEGENMFEKAMQDGNPDGMKNFYTSIANTILDKYYKEELKPLQKRLDEYNTENGKEKLDQKKINLYEFIMLPQNRQEAFTILKGKTLHEY